MSIQVTQEQIEAARNVDLSVFLSARGYQLVRKGRSFCLAEHDSLKIDGNRWHWFSQSIGGNSIDFLVKYEGLSFPAAVLQLTEASHMEYSSITALSDAPAAPDRDKQLNLPERAYNNKRAFWYICVKRGVSSRVFNEAVKSGSVYQNIHGGVTFLGFDANTAEAKYAMSRSTYDNGKYEAVGSDKRYGFVFPRGGSFDSVAVFESAIDALSHASLYPHLKTQRLSLGGVSSLALDQYLESHPEIKTINLNLDNDDPGKEASKLLFKHLVEMFPGRYKVFIHSPPYGKDWNEALIEKRSKDEVIR